MITLGVETSGLTGMMALCRDGELLAERVLEQSRRRHAQTLILEVGALLGEFGLAPRDVGVVAVSIGPGSFTGLRVGVVFAKTFAWATRCGLVAVDTLHAIAAAAPDDCETLDVVSDAQREQLFVGRFERTARRDWQRVGPIIVRDNGHWAESADRVASPGFAVTGPGIDKLLADREFNVRVLDEAARLPRAGHVARLGEQQARNGLVADPVALEPFYLRRSSAEEKRDALRTAR